MALLALPLRVSGFNLQQSGNTLASPCLPGLRWLQWNHMPLDHHMEWGQSSPLPTDDGTWLVVATLPPPSRTATARPVHAHHAFLALLLPQGIGLGLVKERSTRRETCGLQAPAFAAWVYKKLRANPQHRRHYPLQSSSVSMIYRSGLFMLFPFSPSHLRDNKASYA